MRHCPKVEIGSTLQSAIPRFGLKRTPERIETSFSWRRKDLVKAVLIGPVTDSDCYTPHEWEVRQVCSILEAWEEEFAMGLWREQFEALPPKLKLGVPSNL